LLPRAGGLYDYLRAAYGPVWGFFYGWASLLVIMSGGIAAIAVGFGEYLGSFVPWFASDHALFTVAFGGGHWTPDGAQLAAVLAILVLSAVNHLGVRSGAAAQNLLTVLKLASLAGFVILGLLAPYRAHVAHGVPLAAFSLAGFSVAMIAALWTYD